MKSYASLLSPEIPTSLSTTSVATAERLAQTISPATSSLLMNPYLIC